MKKLISISGLFMLTLAYMPASANNWHGYHHAQARLAEKLQKRASYLPRRYQTANAFDPASGNRQGAAWIVRSKNGFEGRIMSNVPTAGDPYTLWVVIFNNPSACDGPCDDPDIANPEVGASIFNGSGAISTSNGKGGGVVNLNFDVVAGNLPNDLFVLVGEGSGLRRNNGYDAQVVLVIDQHPAITPGADSWIGDLTETNFPGMGPATSITFAIFIPCPDLSCPPSVL